MDPGRQVRVLMFELRKRVMNYFINIGSNLGNRKLNISKALQRIMGRYGWFEMSKMVETAPWGYDSDNRFMNVGLRLVSDKDPAEVLRDMQEIEVEISPASHRDAEGNYMDRVIDIDIVAVDELKIDTPDLQVPHPHLAEREFFLKPMVELAPVWRHPDTGMTPGQMLALLVPPPEPDDHDCQE